MFYGRIVHPFSFFFNQSAISCAVSTSSVLVPISTGLMVDVGPCNTSNQWTDHSLHLLLMLPQRCFFRCTQSVSFPPPFTQIFSLFLSSMCTGCSRFHKWGIWALKSPVHSSFTHSFSLCLPSRQDSIFLQWSSVFHWPSSAWLRALGLWHNSVSSVFN